MTERRGTTCDHCGRICGDFAGGYSSVSGALWGGTFQLCHPNEEGRPDCYRLVTVYRETIGVRRDV